MSGYLEDYLTVRERYERFREVCPDQYRSLLRQIDDYAADRTEVRGSCAVRAILKGWPDIPAFERHCGTDSQSALGIAVRDRLVDQGWEMDEENVTGRRHPVKVYYCP